MTKKEYLYEIKNYLDVRFLSDVLKQSLQLDFILP
jgi:hypothetical protein